MKIRTHVKKGDQVEVIAGNHKGKQGTVIEVRAGKNQVVVEGARKLKKAMRKSAQHPDGGLIEIDGPVHISNVKKLG